MPADMIFGYVALAAVFGIASGALLSWDAPGSLAKQFLIGSLWPISVPVAALWALFLGARAVVHSFGEWRGPRIPTAQATRTWCARCGHVYYGRPTRCASSENRETS